MKSSLERRKRKKVVFGSETGGSRGGGDAQPGQTGQHASGVKPKGEKNLCFTVRGNDSPTPLPVPS